MADLVLTALYDNAAAAQSARDGLVAAGVPSANILVHGGTTTDAAGSWWNRLEGVTLPHTDRHLYTEGLRRGGHLVTVRVPAALEAEAIAVLERYAPLDLDERAGTWRAEGWRPDDGERLPPEEDPRRFGGLGDSIAYAATPVSTPPAHAHTHAPASGLAEPAASYAGPYRRVRRYSYVPTAPVTSTPP